MYILLFLIWVIFNGRLTVEIAILGIIITSAVYWFMCHCLEYDRTSDLKIFKNMFKSIHYVFVLFWEVIKSSFLVLKFVAAKEIEIQPQIVFFKSPLKNEFLKTVLANSITLTPGTITINVTDDIFCVHALDYTLAQDFEDSIFIKLLKEMEDNL